MNTEFSILTNRVKDLEFELNMAKSQNTLFNSGNIVLFKWKYDNDLPISYVTENVFHLLGYKAEDLISGKIKYHDLVNEFDIQRFLDEIKNNISSDNPFYNHTPYRLRRSNGEFIWVNDHTMKILDSDGNVSELMGYLYDITEIKQDEEKLAQAYNDMEWKSWELETAKKELESEVVLRLLSEQKAIVNEEKLNNILNSIEDVVWSMNYPDLTIIYISPSVEAVYGKTIKDFYSNTFTGFQQIHPEDKPFVNSKLEESIIKNEQELEYRIIRSDGSIRWLRDRFKTARDKHDNPIRLDGITTDITERKKAELALKESEVRFRLLADNTIDMIALHELDGRYIYISPSVEKLLGYNPDELIGCSPYDLFHPEDIERIKKESHDYVKEGKTVVYIQYRIKTKKGNYIWFETSTSPITNSDGKVIQLQTTSRDITDRKEAENTIKQLTEEYEVIFNGTQDALFMIDVIDRNTYKYRRTNQSHFNLTGLTSQSLRGKTPNELLGQELGEIILANYQRCCDSQEPIQYEEILNLPGGERTWATTLTPVAIDKEIRFIIGSSQDITRRKSAEEQMLKLLNEIQLSKESLEAAMLQKDTLIEELENTKHKLQSINSEKDKFFSIIAHDLKNPFSGFLGLTQIMSEQMLDLTMRELQTYAIDLQESATNLYKLLENLLEWSRMQRGVTSFTPDNYPLYKIVEQNISYMTERSKQKEINFVNLVDESIYIYVDLQMIDTVFRNLISNSVKFTPRGGTIEISTKLYDEAKLTVCIKDSGIGMDADILGKLFQIDQKVSRQGTEGESSTGLGLLLCKEFIQKNSGEIFVESEVGKGSTFSFTLRKSVNIDDED